MNYMENSEAINCSQIVAYNESSVVTTWSIITTDNECIYISDNYAQYTEWVFDLSKLNLEIGNQVKLQAYSKDNNNETILTYIPNSATCYYEQVGTSLTLINIIQSAEKPPILTCTIVRFMSYHTSFISFALFTIDRALIYESASCRKCSTTTVDLSRFHLQPGTHIIVKAIVTGADDCYVYIILEYLPDSLAVADFVLYGSTAESIFEYKKI